MTIFETLEQLDYGELHFGYDKATGMKALVGIHSTRLGPSLGGTRIRFYETEAAAIDDVTRLARGMSYKAALAGLKHGGGKAVIMAPADLASWSADQRAALFRAFGRFVDNLGGRYITTEDSGTSPSDMDVIRTVTKHVMGSSGGSGDPSPFTALGVRRGIEVIAHKILGRADLKGLHVAIQGVGHVGAHLAQELVQAGARLTVSDVDAARAKAVATETGATLVAPEAILETACDVLAPCALGGPITEANAPKIRCKVVAGAANNVLRTAAAGEILAARGIFYAPDYVINAGGLINVAAEFEGYDKKRATDKVMKIYDTVGEVIERARATQQRPEVVADKMGNEILGL